MKYRFHHDTLSLSEKICEINHVTLKDLDVSGFEETQDIALLNEFKKILLM